MDISAKQSGGFAGIIENLETIDTSQLDSATARRIEQLARSLDSLNLSGATLGADLITYQFTISEGGHEHTVVFQDDGSPEIAPVRELWELLTRVKPS